MNALPRGWAWATIDDLQAPEARAITDGPFGSNLTSAHYTASGARVVRLQNIGDGTFIDEKAYISLPHFASLKAHEAVENDVLLASLGTNLPRACLMPKLDVPAIVKADCIRLRPHLSIDPRWIVHALSAPQSRSAAAAIIRGVGRPRLGLHGLRRIPLPIPPLAEQLRIVAALEAHLSRLDAGRQAMGDAARRLPVLWTSVLGRLSSGQLIESARARSRLVRDVAAVGGGIQKQGKRAPVKNKYPFLRVANVGRGRIDLSEVHEVELFPGELDRYALRAGDLLVVEGNGSPDQVGRGARWDGQVDDCVHQNHLIRVRPGADLLPEYLELAWNSPDVARQLREVARSTSGLYTLSTAKVKNVRVPVPPTATQRALVEAAQGWNEKRESLGRSLAVAELRAGAACNSVRREAFAGRLVPQDPSDEPADVLLKRIRAERERAPKPRRGRRAGVFTMGSGAVQSELGMNL